MCYPLRCQPRCALMFLKKFFILWFLFTFLVENETLLSICNFAPRPPQVADPVVTFCETVVETSSLKCFAETPNKKYVSRVIFLDLIQTNNSMRAVWDRLLI